MNTGMHVCISGRLVCLGITCLGQVIVACKQMVSLSLDGSSIGSLSNVRPRNGVRGSGLKSSTMSWRNGRVACAASIDSCARDGGALTDTLLRTKTSLVRGLDETNDPDI